MKHLKSYVKTFSIRYAFGALVISTSCFTESKANALISSSVQPADSATPAYAAIDAVYFVLKAETNKDQFTHFENILKGKGINFKVNKVEYNSAHLLSLIDYEITIPSSESVRLTAGNGKDALASPVVFIYEAGKITTFKDGKLPEDISTKARLTVDDNLNGLVVVSNHSIHMSGHFPKGSSWNK
jgi:hypothetical protein